MCPPKGGGCQSLWLPVCNVTTLLHILCVSQPYFPVSTYLKSSVNCFWHSDLWLVGSVAAGYGETVCHRKNRSWSRHLIGKRKQEEGQSGQASHEMPLLSGSITVGPFTGGPWKDTQNPTVVHSRPLSRVGSEPYLWIVKTMSQSNLQFYFIKLVCLIDYIVTVTD